MKRLFVAGLAAAAVLATFAAPAQAAATVVSNSPIVGIAASPSAGGYWQAASDGGVFTEEAFLELAGGGAAGSTSKGNHVHCGWPTSVA